MDFGHLIYASPLWLLFVFTMVFSMLGVGVGTWLARLALRHEAKEPEAPLGSLVSAVLGLLAFILAFTFGMTAARFDARRALVLEESNAVGTTYLRAGLLPEPRRLEVRRLLREYVDSRLKPTLGSLHEALLESEKIHRLLWAQAELLVQEKMDPQLRTLFVTSLNEVIDLHQSRKTVALLYRIPGPIWLAVYLLSTLTMVAIGYQVGMAGARWLRGMPVMTAAFSLVIVMIADIDRPGEGNIVVSQQPLADVKQMMLQDAP